MSEARARAGWSAASAGAPAVFYFIMARGLQASATMWACALDRALPCPRTAVQGVSGQGGEDVR